MESSSYQLVNLTKKALDELDSKISLNFCYFENENIHYLCRKREECRKLLLTLENIIKADNKNALEAFDTTLNTRDRQVLERLRVADKVMKLLHERKMISPLQYSIYLLQGTSLV